MFQFKIEFLLLFTGCGKALGKMSGSINNALDLINPNAQLIKPNIYVALIDLKDMLSLVPIHEED